MCLLVLFLPVNCAMPKFAPTADAGAAACPGHPQYSCGMRASADFQASPCVALVPLERLSVGSSHVATRSVQSSRWCSAQVSHVWLAILFRLVTRLLHLASV